MQCDVMLHWRKEPVWEVRLGWEKKLQQKRRQKQMSGCDVYSAKSGETEAQLQWP